MSTILKALQRLEEDGSPVTTNPSDTLPAAGTLPATDPRAADELRDRILAEESAAQAAAAPPPDAARTKRLRSIAAAAVLVLASGALAISLWPATDSDPDPEVAVLTAASPPVVTPPTQRPDLPVQPSAAPVPSEASPPPPATEEAQAEPSLALRGPDRPNSAPSAVDDSTSVSDGTPIASASPSATPSASSPPPSAIESSPPTPTAAPSPIPTPIPSPIVTSTANPTSVAESAPRAQASSELPSEPEPRAVPSETLAPSRRPMPTTIAAVDPPPSVSAPEANPARGSITFEESTRAAPIAPEPQVQPPSVERLDRRGLPEITILRTAWHPEPARRSARIRMEATDEVINLKEGDAVDQFVIQTISPSAVLFKIGDIEIRRRVGQP